MYIFQVLKFQLNINIHGLNGPSPLHGCTHCQPACLPGIHLSPGLGSYPAVSLSEAHQQREDNHRMLMQNINPVQQRATEQGLLSPENIFKTMALDWHKNNRKWPQNTADHLLASMNNHIFPVIGHLSVTELKPRHFIDLLKGIEAKGLLEVASRTRQHLCNIMRHAVHQGFIDSNPAANLGGVTIPPVKRHYPALPPERLPELLERIDGYQKGHELTHKRVLFSGSGAPRYHR